jgi:hypothetical protein
VWTEIATKYAIASTACANLGFNLCVISAAILPTNPNELNYLIQQCLREVILTNSALLLDCDEVNSADTSREFAISQLVAGLNIPLILSTQERMRQRLRPTITIDVNQPTYSEQRDIWEFHLGSVALELNGHIDRLVSQFNLSTTTIQSACLSLNHVELEYLPEREETFPLPVHNRQSKPQILHFILRIPNPQFSINYGISAASKRVPTSMI